MYKAVISMMIEVHKVEDENVCTGNILSEEEMKKYQLSKNMLASISGATQNDCLTKLKEWVKDVK